jgi:hypothetical protein
MYERAKQRLRRKAKWFALVIGVLVFAVGIARSAPSHSLPITWTDQNVTIQKVGTPSEPNDQGMVTVPVFVYYRVASRSYKFAWTKIHADQWSSDQIYEGTRTEFCIGSNGQLIDMGNYGDTGDNSCPPVKSQPSFGKRVVKFGKRVLPILGIAIATGLAAFQFFRVLGAKLWLNALLVGWVRFRWIKALLLWPRLRKQRLEQDKPSAEFVALQRTIAELEMYPEGVIPDNEMEAVRRALHESWRRKYEQADIILAATRQRIKEDRQRDKEQAAALRRLS